MPVQTEYNAAAAIEGLRAVGRRVADGFNNVGLATSVFNYLGKVTIENFRGQHSPDGEPWRDLSDVTTQAFKRVEAGGAKTKVGRRTGTARAMSGRDHKALQDEGLLFQSLVPQALGGQAIRETSADTLRYGTNVPYAHVHQDGKQMAVTARQSAWMQFNLGVFKPVGSVLTIPQRQFLGLTDEAENRLAQILEYWVVEGETSAWQ